MYLLQQFDTMFMRYQLFGCRKWRIVYVIEKNLSVSLKICRKICLHFLNIGDEEIYL